jgi:hypothetical protein
MMPNGERGSFRLGSLALIVLVGAGCGASVSVPAASAAPQLGKIKHIVFIVQENHTFDSIFGGPNPFPGAETASSGRTSTGATIPLQPQYMGDSGGTSGLPNNYSQWIAACDPDPSVPLKIGQPSPCRMDGFDKIVVAGGNGTDAYTYARYDQTAPYFDIARKYALADHFFASHNSESYTAHQYLFAGQSGFHGTLDAPVTVPAVPKSPVAPLVAWTCEYYAQLHRGQFQLGSPRSERRRSVPVYRQPRSMLRLVDRQAVPAGHRRATGPALGDPFRVDAAKFERADNRYGRLTSVRKRVWYRDEPARFAAAECAERFAIRVCVLQDERWRAGYPAIADENDAGSRIEPNGARAVPPEF